MARLWLIALVALVATLAVPVATAFAGAPGQSAVTATTTADLRLRVGPSTSHAQMSVVPNGTTVQVLGRNAAANWIYIDHAGARGWIAAWYTTINGDLNSAPVTDSSGGWQQVTSTGVKATATDSVRLRAGPGTLFRTVGLVGQGATVPIIGRTAASDWLLVEHRTMRGWIYRSYASVSGDLNAVPLSDGQGSAAPVQSAPQPVSQPAPQPQPPPPAPPPAASSGEAAEMIRLINQARCERGIPPLAENGMLNASALEHANDMANGNFFSHVDPSGRTMADHARGQGYDFTGLAENLAAGRGSVGEVFGQWWGSSLHQANMLNPGLREAGLAHVYRAGTAYGHYWVLQMGNRPGASGGTCPR